MGSGHILIYAFDVFMQLYQAKAIQHEKPPIAVTNNLFGLDIDRRLPARLLCSDDEARQ